MCGLICIVGQNVSQAELERSNDLLWHRGPDDGHVHVGEGVALGARRLSIVDLHGGRQPLCNEDGSVWITYNGEIFNAPELRHELEALGHVFRTRTDTEAIVHAYEEWGTDAIVRLRGMFAFAIWDARRERLVVARDRFGIKPLYYAQSGGRFACGSEIRPIFSTLPTLTREANRTALWRLFEIGHVPTPLSPFENVHQLPAAHFLVYENKQISIQRYWQLCFPESRQIGREEATELFMAQLRESVSAWRMGDVPVGSLLSGGLDSSALAALLTEIGGEPIHTFNIAFDAASHNESEQARDVARVIGSEHHQVHFGSAEFDQLPSIISHLESPQLSMTSIAIYLLYKACRDAGFKVILTGEGADELLGGYHWFDGDRRVQPLLNIPRPLRRLVAKLPLPISADGKRVLANGANNVAARYAVWQQRIAYSDRGQLLKLPNPKTNLWESWQFAQRGDHPLHQFLSLDTQTRMVDFINFEVDRMSMANSVEARPPFLDDRLWDLCLSLPPEFKLSGVGNKLLLRWGMEDILPKNIGNRPKQGLATPHSLWWRQAKLPSWAEEALHASALSETGHFDANTFNNLRKQHQDGKRDNSAILTGVLTTQLWHDQFLT